jgi:hypothetical protein
VTLTNKTPYLTGEDKIVVQLGSTELSRLRGFVRDVAEIVKYDNSGVTDDLIDSVLIAAEILKVHVDLDGEKSDY